jgi:hypothetical protein
MPVNILEAKQHAHELIEQLGPDQIVAVLQLLEVMVEPEDEALTEEDRLAVKASREHFRQHPDEGVPFEQFAAECGFTMDQILGHKD